MALAAPTGQLALKDVVAAPPGSTEAVLRGISFELQAGQSMGIVGPSGSGKSTLAKVILGVWPAARGTVRLDGAGVGQLDLDLVGAHLGYLPQSAELLPGTVAENIRRLGDDDPGGVAAAATRAGAHEMILALPEGYDTLIGKKGFALSGGQVQRIALARALYGSPRLVILDEPDADLDQQGELALIRAIEQLRADGVTVIVIAHRAALVRDLDMLLVIDAGEVAKFGSMHEFREAPKNPKVRIVR